MAQKRDWNRAILEKKIAERGFTSELIHGPISPFWDHRKPMALTNAARIKSESNGYTADIAELRSQVDQEELVNLLSVLEKGIDILRRSSDYRVLERGFFLIPKCDQRDRVLELLETNLGISIRVNASDRLGFTEGQKSKHKSKFRVDLLKRKIRLLCGEEV